MSGQRGISRKVFDVAGALTSNLSYNGGGSPTTGWATGIGGPLWLTDLTQGVTDNDRIGYSIAIESLDIRFKITPDGSAASNGCTDQLRIIVAADNECDGVYPTITEILGDAAGASTSLATGLMVTYLQPAYFGRFRIIDDKYITWLPPPSTTNNVTAHIEGGMFHDWHHDMRDHKVVWDMTDASAIANARKGHIFVYFLYERISTATGGIPVLSTTTPPTINYAFRIRYRDA